MLFSSLSFLFGFLPALLLAASFARLGGARIYPVLLITASTVFYAWFVPAYVFLLGISALFNFVLSTYIEKGARPRLFAVGIAANLLALGYFKYWNFTVENFDQLFGLPFSLHHIVLPLAISFITFEQIAFLSDVHSGRVERGSLAKYLAFITLFPKLIAGPIIRYTEMLPQFMALRTISMSSFVTGLCIFFVGLFKKVAIADQLGPTVDRIYGAATSSLVTGQDAALATAAYAAQIYFDFSGYSDMAIGLAWMLGLTLPVNFYSPYKASSIIEFWRRWHITLSRFLRDYLYIPLGGSRGSRHRTYTNLLLVMTLGGLWHGAGWTFVVWGLLHGVALVANHVWNAARPKALSESKVGILAGHLVTLGVVLIGWVFFRAADLPAAGRIIRSLAYPGAVSIDNTTLYTLAVAWLVMLFGPNTAQMFGYRYLFTQRQEDFLRPIPLVRYKTVVFVGVLAAIALILTSGGNSNAFIYFQF